MTPNAPLVPQLPQLRQPNPFGHWPDPSWRTQMVRIIDLIMLGPVMIVGAYKATQLPLSVRWFIGLAGGATMLFNGVNFFRAANQQRNGVHRPR